MMKKYSEKESTILFGKIFKIWIFPILLYLLFFIILTFPLILNFHTHFFTDTGDGLQNVWNIWWINKAVTELHQNPWYTAYLHYPQGTSLLGQTLNPFNGFMGILLLKFLSLIETHNIIIIFSFVMGGFTTFILAHSLTRSYWSGLIAGYIFTFSQFHFMHAEGHMQLVSLEWIPLFIFCWYNFIKSPGIPGAFASALVLFAVLLCDHYYFLFCILSGIIMVIWYAVNTKNYMFFLTRKYLENLFFFTILCILTSGVLVYNLLQINRTDPLIGAHDPFTFSLDLLAPFIPGGHWRFAQLTEVYWSKLPGNIHESSVYIGLSAIILIIYTWFNRKKIKENIPSLNYWYFIIFFFSILALGPALNVAGNCVYRGIMPYDFIQALFPPMKLSGCPVRMMVMVILGVSIICASGISLLLKNMNKKINIFLFSTFLIMLIVDTLPKPLPLTRIETPEYVKALSHRDDNGALIDTVTPSPLTLYFQTIHEIPLGTGYISRYPTSVYNEHLKKIKMIEKEEYFKLFDTYNIHYLLIPVKDSGESGDKKVRLLNITNKKAYNPGAQEIQ